MARAAENNARSSGVDALITKLREEGVAAGRSEADRILAEAKSQAQQILDKAQAEAKGRLESARREADSYRAAGEAALQTAMRDTVLDMRGTLMQRFSADVKRLVSHHLQDHDVLKQMILEVAGRVREDAETSGAEQLEVILPEEVVGLEELRRNPEALRQGALTNFVLGLTGEMLRDGVTFTASDDKAAGIRIYMKDKDIALDLSEAAVADLLLQHLQPRFRATLEGVIK